MFGYRQVILYLVAGLLLIGGVFGAIKYIEARGKDKAVIESINQKLKENEKVGEAIRNRPSVEEALDYLEKRR